ncbi:hypothetical protein CQ018_06460 [Arthrobacter sp. MYb227]|uniref:hypothetical protein n=1 Tax=Arthrobacter sp. MYb227 TaxID=1848601 RepID=UPI000CFB49AE|nr:hypothetical protein [Arthrobacter sp. MYb227]PQZ94975.1 hypothetical protein CQ018_06460 [Arthrobacter sp. MYb227]
MGYESTGGVGSIEFSFEELERTALMLRNAAEDLGEGATNLMYFPEPSAALLAIAPARLQLKLLSTMSENKILASLCVLRTAETGALMVKVALSRTLYEQAEAEAQRLTNAARGKWLPVLFLWDLTTNARRPRNKTMEALINESPEIIGRLFPSELNPGANFRDKEHGGAFDTTVAQRLYPALSQKLDKLGVVQLGTVEVAAANSQSTLKTGAGVDTLLELQHIAELEPPGSILISTVQGSARPTHIVTIPGTQDSALRPESSIRHIAGSIPAGMSAQNPWEFAGIAEGMGFGSQQVSVAVSEALVDAGAKPGDKIVLSGYSQGGIHAANLAGDTRITNTYEVAYLLTAGSPVALAAVPKSTQALHLEDREDMVPGTDGSDNPSSISRVTVYFDHPDLKIALNADGFGPAHKLENYRDHGRELIGSTDPSIARSTAELSALLAGAGSLRVRSYGLRRIVNETSKPQQKPKVKGWPMRDPHQGIHPTTSGWG